MSGAGIEAIGQQLRMVRPEDTTSISDGFDQIPGINEGSLAETQSVGFSDALVAAVDDAATRGHDAHQMAQDFAAGRLDDLHGTMIASEEAGISVKLVGSMRNKLLEAFQELWRIHV